MREKNALVCPYCLQIVDSLQYGFEGSRGSSSCSDCVRHTGYEGDQNIEIGSYICVGDDEEE